MSDDALTLEHAPVVYVAGPMGKEPGVEERVDVATLAALRLADAGLAFILPHLSYYAHEKFPRPYQLWLGVDFALIRRLDPDRDALLRLPGASPGADREVALAQELGVPVFRSVEAILLWAAKRHASGCS